MSEFETGAARILERCNALARITDVPGGTTRTFLSPAMLRANEIVAAWMQEAALDVRMDAAGNLRGRREGQGTGKTLTIASHLDTVPNAGAYDGVLGVMVALAVAEHFAGTALPFALEVIACSDEEGVRFGEPFIGSRALVGTLDEALLTRTDARGISVRQALRQAGMDEEKLPEAVLRDAAGFLEVHLEQGPVLEDEGLPLGVVESICGQSRYALTFTGEANHAGTTPMRLRHDALAAAGEWITEVERTAQQTPGLVATVGAIDARPGAGNVIAGEVLATLDVRSANDETRSHAVAALLGAAEACGSKRGVGVRHTLRLQQPAVRMDPSLSSLLEDAVDSTGCLIRRINSGAGHDAMVVAPHVPAAMLFVRTPGGLSHHPDENVLPGDVAVALEAAVSFVRALAGRHSTVGTTV